jgi:hypothetical protein
MQGGADIYGPIWLPVGRFGALCLIIVGILVGRWVLVRYLQKLALKRQQLAVSRAQTKDTSKIDQTLSQLEALRAAYLRGELSASGAAEQASALVRELYDSLMNHQTRYQARYEIASRRLEKLATLISSTYPVEFASTHNQIAQEAVEHMFAQAKEVVESCR